MTNYYIRKYLYLGWNGSDESIETMPKSIFFIRWAQYSLTFAEAANGCRARRRKLYGYTPQAGPRLSAEAAPTNDGMPGVGRRRTPISTAGPGRVREARAQRTPHRTLLRGAAFLRPAPLGDGRHRTERLGEQAGHLRRADQPRRGRKAQLPIIWVPIPYTEMIRMEKDGAERRMVQLGIKNNAL